MRADEIKINRMYDEFAHLWPLISPAEGYAEEAAHWRRVLRDKLGPGRHEILELGVGGGNNLSHLTNDFKATAVDLSEKMLANSRQLNPDVEHHVGDMRSVRLGRTYQAVIIHDAINYMLTEDDIRATLATVSAHLESGGVFVTSPDYTTEVFHDRMSAVKTRSDEVRTLNYVEYDYDPVPGDSQYECLFVYIISEGGQVRVEHDRHILGLFPKARWLELMEEAGFGSETYDYDVHPDGHEGYLFVGVKR